jgi:hypothetical protein
MASANTQASVRVGIGKRKKACKSYPEQGQPERGQPDLFFGGLLFYCGEILLLKKQYHQYTSRNAGIGDVKDGSEEDEIFATHKRDPLG